MTMDWTARESVKQYNSIKQLGLVSDTHGCLEEVVLTYLAGKNLILHAGDICDGRNSKGRLTEEEILAKLRRVAPVLAVQGNVDKKSLLPDLLLFYVNSSAVRGVMVHGHKHRIKWSQNDISVGRTPQILSKELKEIIAFHKLNLVIFGHSHIPGAVCSDGVVYINPGSAGPKRFSLPRTVSILTFSETKLLVEIFDIVKLHRIKNLEVINEMLG